MVRNQRIGKKCIPLVGSINCKIGEDLTFGGRRPFNSKYNIPGRRRKTGEVSVEDVGGVVRKLGEEQIAVGKELWRVEAVAVDVVDQTIRPQLAIEVRRERNDAKRDVGTVFIRAGIDLRTIQHCTRWRNRCGTQRPCIVILVV